MSETYIVCEKNFIPLILHFTEADITNALELLELLRLLNYGNFECHSTEEDAVRDYNHREEFLTLLGSLM